MILRRLLTALLLLCGVVAAVPAFAQSTTTPTVCGSTTDYASALQTCGIAFAGVTTTCQTTGDCSLTDVMQVFVNISNFILSIVGTLILVFFIYGGFRFLTAAGNPETIAAGTNAMKNSVIGLLIVFTAFAAVNFLTGALRGGSSGQQNLCELVSPAQGGKAGLGYACLDTSSPSMSAEQKATCLPNLCPGGTTIQCCLGTGSSATTTP